MTVPATTRRAGPYTGNGVTTTFSFGFKTYAASDLQVVKTNSSDVESTLVLDSDYSVSLNVDQDASPGGTITYPITGSKLALSEKLTITGDLEYEQTTDLLGGGSFNARVIEDTFDRTVIQIQQLQEQIDRALKVPVSSSTSPTLPQPLANAVIGWNETATGLQNVDVEDLVTSVAYSSVIADVFSGDGATTTFNLSTNPGAQNNLTVTISGVTQRPNLDYTWASGTALVFLSAPPSGTSNILVKYAQAVPVGSLGSQDFGLII